MEEINECNQKIGEIYAHCESLKIKDIFIQEILINYFSKYNIIYNKINN